MMHRVLGPAPGMIDDWSDEAPKLAAPGGQAMLVYLYLASNIGKSVGIDTLIRVLYTDDYLPVNPRNAVQGCIYDIHKAFDRQLEISWREGEQSYCLPGAPDEVDGSLLATLAGEATRELRAERFEQALGLSRSATDLWRGPILAKFASAPRGKVIAKRYEDAYDLALAVYAESLIGLGRFAEAATMLAAVLEDAAIAFDSINGAEVPRLERDPELWSLYVRALWMAGKSDEALKAFERAELVLRSAAVPIPGSLEKVKDEMERESSGTQATPPTVRSSDAPRVTLRDVLPADSRGALDLIDPGDTPDRAFSELIETAAIADEFELVLVSGVSAAGKDAIVHYASRRASPAQRFQILRKFTTRPRRPNEPTYSVSVDDALFEEMLRDGQLIWPYQKRSVLYAFDRAQLEQCMRRGRKLVAIVTEFDQVPQIVSVFRNKGVSCVPVFIDAPRETVDGRTAIRGFDEAEEVKRLRSIMDDFERMGLRTEFRSEYVFIPHSNEERQGVYGAVEEMLAVLDGSSRRLADWLRAYESGDASA